MAKPSIKIIIFTFIFAFSFIPLVLPLIGVGNATVADYSIYNNNWNGLSTFKSAVEREGYQVKPIISSISSINRINNRSILLMIGPSTMYDTLSALALVDYLNEGGNVIIADDFGSSSSLLSILTTLLPGVGLFEGHLLLDAGSYDKNVSLPLITSFNSHPVFDGVDTLILNYATVIAGSALTPLAYTSSLSWLDANANYAYDSGEHIGPFTVIASANYGNGSMILISDPSIFSNDMINRADNLRFAINLVNWAAGYNTSTLIIFDEGHRLDVTASTFFFGTILGEVNWISSNWLLAPLYPIITVYLVKSWLPKREKKPVLYEASKPFKSAFSSKIDWYKISQNYNKAVEVLFKKLKKDLLAAYHLNYYDIGLVADAVLTNKPEIKRVEVEVFLKNLEALVKSGKIIVDKDIFLRVFLDIYRFREKVGLKW
ncbi:MAG: DUF4350 domain-containing protein [Candidatus Odinarchaeota archaeon]